MTRLWIAALLVMLAIGNQVAAVEVGIPRQGFPMNKMVLSQSDLANVSPSGHPILVAGGGDFERLKDDRVVIPEEDLPAQRNAAPFGIGVRSVPQSEARKMKPSPGVTHAAVNEAATADLPSPSTTKAWTVIGMLAAVILILQVGYMILWRRRVAAKSRPAVRSESLHQFIASPINLVRVGVTSPKFSVRDDDTDEVLD